MNVMCVRVRMYVSMGCSCFSMSQGPLISFEIQELLRYMAPKTAKQKAMLSTHRTPYHEATANHY